VSGSSASPLPESLADLPVVLLSHRGPVSFDRDALSGERTTSRGAGGLVTALSGLAGHLDDAVWVCVAAGEEDVAVAREAGGKPLHLALDDEPRLLGDGDNAGRSVALRLVDVPPDVHEAFYGTVANPLLWFLQHRLHNLGTSPALTRKDRAAFEGGYAAANRLAAEAVVEQVQAAGGNGVVLLHDYHFYLVGELVRQHCPDVLLSHFVHIPWPGPDAWRVLPPDIRERILEGLLGCDVVAFHTEADARAFLLCVQELLGLLVDLKQMEVQIGSRRIRARAYPISIDIAALEETAHSEAAEEHLGTLEAQLGEGTSLMLRVDRTDPSKNIVRGFTAYDLLLDEHPELHGTVVFLAMLQPSRQDVPEYAAYLAEIGAAAASVNAKHGTGDWQPVDLRLASDMALAAAAYRRCDVLVVNAVADGMNLVAKEAVVVNERSMVLALSEATGAHDELGRFAVTLHPFDVSQQADALHEALTMDPQLRRDRHEHAAEVVRRNDVRRWLAAQLGELAALRARR
jgi:trehalose 6-phosphate synthase